MSSLLLDEKDLEILKNLLIDSRTKLSFIAEKANVSVPTISSRLDKLLQLNIITRFTLDLNMNLLSDHPSYMIAVQLEPNKIETCLESLYQYPLIEYIYEILANYQVLIKTAHISLSEYNQLIHKLRREPGLKTLDTWTITQIHKINPIVLPKKEIKVKLTCTYCNKSITQDFRVVMKNEKSNYLCCNTCESAFKLENEIY